jgi:hypothetical protein
MARGDFVLKVGGVSMPCPSAFDWSLQDVSAGESGRTDDAKMQKNRIAQKRKIQLSWSNPTASEASTILKAFNPEYIYVNYWDAMDGKQETRTFYVGDRTAPVKTWWVGNKRFETVSFDIIER